jgi:hypothetical protein
MTMVGLTQEQRDTLRDKLADAANLALGALLFGQFLDDRPFSPLLAGARIFSWVVLLGWSLVLGGGRR